MPRKRFLQRTLGAVVLFAAGVSPFAAYIALKATETTPPPAWPADVAIVTAEAGSLRSLALLHFTAPDTAMIVRFPVETSLSVPAAGTLRALTAYGIGGAPMLARGLDETANVDAPFWALWSRGAAAGRPPDSSNLDSHTAEVVAMIADPATSVVTAPGTIETRSGVAYYELDHERLALALQGVPVSSPSATASPTPTPTSSSSQPGPASTSVEVLNQGGSAGAAAAAASKLQQAGYVDIKVGNSPRRDIDGTTVYYKTSREAAEAVARVIGSSVTQIAQLPSSIATTADVLVLVGREPRRAASSPRPRTTSQSPSPTPSESAVVVP